MQSLKYPGTFLRTGVNGTSGMVGLDTLPTTWSLSLGNVRGTVVFKTMDGRALSLGPGCTFLLASNEYPAQFVPYALDGYPGSVVLGTSDCEDALTRFIAVKDTGEVVLTPTMPTANTARSFMWTLAAVTTSAPPTATPTPSTFAPTPSGTPIPITLTPALNVPSVAVIESARLRGSFVQMRAGPGGGSAGSVVLDTAEAPWYLSPGEQNSVVLRFGSATGPALAAGPGTECDRAVVWNGVSGARSSFRIFSTSENPDAVIIGTIDQSGAGACYDGRVRFLGTQPNGTLALFTDPPGRLTMASYLWLIKGYAPPTARPTPGPPPLPGYLTFPNTLVILVYADAWTQAGILKVLAVTNAGPVLADFVSQDLSQVFAIDAAGSIRSAQGAGKFVTYSNDCTRLEAPESVSSVVPWRFIQSRIERGAFTVVPGCNNGLSLSVDRTMQLALDQQMRGWFIVPVAKV